jgi:hypothetical protein
MAPLRLETPRHVVPSMKPVTCAIQARRRRQVRCNGPGWASSSLRRIGPASGWSSSHRCAFSMQRRFCGTTNHGLRRYYSPAVSFLGIGCVKYIVRPLSILAGSTCMYVPPDVASYSNRSRANRTPMDSCPPKDASINHSIATGQCPSPHLSHHQGGAHVSLYASQALISSDPGLACCACHAYYVFLYEQDPD